MPVEYVVSYLLLGALAVLSAWCLLLALSWLLDWPRGRAAAASPAEAADEGGVASYRRCEGCGARWKATEQDRPSERRLRSLRRRRRLRRALGQQTRRLPASWERCPHCFSTDVRASGAGRSSRAAR